MPASTHAGHAKIRVVENIEELRFEPELEAFGQGEPFRQIEIAPEEIRSAQSVAAQISKLAVLRRVSAVAGSRAGINGGDESVGIEPLNRAGLRHAGNRIVFVSGNAGNDTGELRTTALHDAISIGRVGRAENGEWNSAVPEERSGQSASRSARSRARDSAP